MWKFIISGRIDWDGLGMVTRQKLTKPATRCME